MCVLISWTLGGATCVPGTVFGTYGLSLCMNTIAKLMIEVRVRVIVVYVISETQLYQQKSSQIATICRVDTSV